MNPWQLVLRILLGVFRRRKRLVAIGTVVALLILTPAAYYYSKEPPRFRTSAVILIETRPDRVPLFQEFSPYRPLAVQVAILRSRSLGETVIETLPQSSLRDLVDNPYYVDYELAIRNLYRHYTSQELEVESPQRRALKELQNARVGFDVTADGIVTLSATASRPQVSVDIVNTYIEALMARTRSFNIDDARVTREFLEHQLAEVKTSLGTSEQSLRSFVHSHGGVKAPERSQAALGQLGQTESALAEVETSRKMLQARLEAFRQKVETDKRNAPSVPVSAPPRPPAPEVQRIRAMLAQLETTSLDLRTRYTQEHPRVRLIEDRIVELRGQLGDAVREAGPAMPIPGVVPAGERVNFSEQLATLEASFHAVSAQEEALRKKAELLRQSLTGLSANELEYARLARDTDSNRGLYALLSDKLTGARIREQGEMKVVKVIDPPSFPVPTTNEKRLKLLMVAGGFALLLGSGVPAAIEWIYRKVETEEDVVTTTGLPVLAVIPRLRSRRPIFISKHEHAGRRPSEQFIFTEAFRSLRVAVQLGTRTDRVRTLLVASPFAGEGKSTTVLNLGLAFAEIGQRVVVVDTDFQRPTLHQTMDVPPRTGLVDSLQSGQPVEGAMAKVSDGMWLVPRGAPLGQNARGIVYSERMQHVLTELGEKTDLVICDSSPVLVVPDNLFLVGKVDGVILVAKAGSTGCRDLLKAKAQLESAGARILGVVINEVPASSLQSYYLQYYRYATTDAK